ncbi:hypothetical protein LJR296_001433 [Cupriavidus necator]|uniref:hypothetical protein n=1 Tax=Cupriavidus necator TaxID=106590 RepID=UPI003ECE42B4
MTKEEREIIEAAKNLVAVKGRYHTEQAFRRLAAAVTRTKKVEHVVEAAKINEQGVEV